MKKHTDPLHPETYYHIFYRGINKEDLFKEERNYHYFLEKLNHFVVHVANIYAYCLLKNHFHLLIRTKPEAQVKEFHEVKNADGVRNPVSVKASSQIISLQFSHLFNVYTQAINKSYERTGGFI